MHCGTAECSMRRIFRCIADRKFLKKFGAAKIFIRNRAKKIAAIRAARRRPASAALIQVLDFLAMHRDDAACSMRRIFRRVADRKFRKKIRRRKIFRPKSFEKSPQSARPDDARPRQQSERSSTPLPCTCTMRRARSDAFCGASRTENFEKF